MNRPALIQAAYFAVLAIGDEPSVRNVAAMTGRIRNGKEVWREAVRAWLISRIDTVAIQPRHTSDTPAPRQSDEKDTPAAQDRYLRVGVAKVLESEVELPFANAHGREAEPKPKRPKKPPDPLPDWIPPLRAEVAVLNPRLLVSLTPDERYVLARFHALEFGGCTKSEPTNRSRGQPIATGLHDLADRLQRAQRVVVDGKAEFRQLMADVTVSEYIAYGRRIVKRSGRLWYRPIDVIAEIEIEEPHVLQS